MKILVLVSSYPTNENRAISAFFHVRSLRYIELGLDVTVLNFGSKNNYVIDGVNVINLRSYKANEAKYDALACHAPNIRNHYRFVIQYGNLFPHMFFTFHGHEVLKLSEAYPPAYPWQKKSNVFLRFLRDYYDELKFILLRRCFLKIQHKSHFIFVSKCLYNEFKKNINYSEINGRYHIINNAAGKPFEENRYNPKPDYDFLCIRSNMDKRNYSVDIVNDLAHANPNYSFLVIGKGNLFSHIKKAPNLVWENKNLSHIEMVAMLNKCRCAIMPTRRDTQGVTTCEMATLGIPVITSDIAVCKEIFEGFENVALIDNDDVNLNLKPIIEKLESGLPYAKNEKYFSKNTTDKEVELLVSTYKKGEGVI